MSDVANSLFIFDKMHSGALTSYDQAREAKVNTALLKQLFTQPGGRTPLQIEFNLCDDLRLFLCTDYIEPVGSGGFIWRGSLVGIKEVQGVFCALGLFGNGKFSISGQIHIYNDDYTFDSTTAEDVLIKKASIEKL